MLKTLRSRLLLSHLLIIVITVGVIGTALLVMLRARPVSAQEVSERLADALSEAEERFNLDSIAPTGPTRAQEIIYNRTAIRAFVRGLRIRYVLVRDGIVGYDSLRSFQPGAVVSLDSTPFEHRAVPGQETPANMANYRQGNFMNPDGTEWRFVATAPATTGWQLLTATPAPRLLSFEELLNYYADDLFIPLAQAAVIGLLFSVALSVLIARSVTRPLQAVAQKAVLVAQGKLDQPVAVEGPLEAQAVSIAFNQMIQEVAATQRAQREFLANVTHDLRTPLTSIQGFSQAIIDGVASNPKNAQRAAQIIYQESGRLNRMVEELLDLARIEAGRWNMTRHTVQLAEVLAAVGERLSPKAAEKGITLTVQTPILPVIAGDGDRLVQVFTNLTDNALKHTPQGGSVTLRATFDNGRGGKQGVIAQVIDTGIGIAPDHLPRLFDRFYQVDKSRKSGGREGVGLGLTIAKQIVEAHGGTIWVESEEGKGSVFTVWLPTPTPDMSTILRVRGAGNRG
jgi:signal transduction histidine kinase